MSEAFGCTNVLDAPGVRRYYKSMTQGRDSIQRRGQETPTEEELDLVVTQLRQICTESSLDFALRVGGVVIHHFYGGDVEAFRSRGPKLNSFRRLAQHPKLPMSPAALYRCVAVFELCDRLNAPSRWRRLGASHLRAVIGLDSESQERLLSTANREQWTVQTLRNRAVRCRAGDASRGGRKPQSALVKSLSSIRRNLKACELDVDEEVSALELAELEQTALLVAETLSWVENLANLLARRAELNGDPRALALVVSARRSA